MHKIFLARAKQEKDGCINCGRKIINSFYPKRSKEKEYLCQCLLHVSPMSGTPMHRSHIEPNIWFEIIRDIITSDEGIDAKYVETKYQISSVSAWNILHRIKDWINLLEEKEGCLSMTRFVKAHEKFREKYLLKHNRKIPFETMEKKMLDVLPPLFEHLREYKLAA